MGSIYTINLIEIESAKTIAGIETREIKTIAGEEAGSGGGDGFKSVVEASEELVAWWSPNGANAADLADGATAMTSMVESDTNPDMKIKTASTGNWKHVADNPGGSHAPASLTSAVATELQAKTDYCALDNAVSLSTALATLLDNDPHDTSFSGFVFFKMQDTSPDFSYQDILQFSGWIGGSEPGTGTGSDDLATMFIGTWTGNDVYMGGITQNVGQMTDPIAHSTWYYLAFRTGVGGAANLTLYQLKMDGSEAWGDIDGDNTLTTTSNQDYPPRGGLSMGRNSQGGAQSNTDVHWGPIGLFSSDIGIGTEGTTLRTIFEAAAEYHG